MATIENCLDPPQIYFVLIAHIGTIGALEEESLRLPHLCQIGTYRSKFDQVVNLVELLGSSERPHKTLGVVEHVEAALSSSVLLHNGHVPDLDADRVCMLLYFHVSHRLRKLHRWDLLQALTKGRFLVEGIRFVIVSGNNPVILCLHNLGYHIEDDSLEEVDWVGLARRHRSPRR